MSSLKGTQTEKNLLTAFAGESQARNRYSYFASQAKKDGYEQMKFIFEETADQEKEHAKRLFKFLEGGEVEIAAPEHMYEAPASMEPAAVLFDGAAELAGYGVGETIMPESRKLRVFLCHTSQDKPIVRELYQKLKAEGWIDPWLDEEKLLPGQKWQFEIPKAVEEAHAIIVCLSSVSVNKEGYIQKEREGRVNRYQVNSQATLRRQESRDIAVSDLLQVLTREM